MTDGGGAISTPFVDYYVGISGTFSCVIHYRMMIVTIIQALFFLLILRDAWRKFTAETTEKHMDVRICVDVFFSSFGCFPIHKSKSSEKFYTYFKIQTLRGDL